MSDKRKNIRAAIVANLKAATLPCGNNVYANRIRSTWAEDLPVVLVYTTTETVVISELSQPSYERTMKLVIEARVKADDGLDDTLDDFARDIEAAINADQNFGGLAVHSTLADLEFDFAPQGETLIGGVKLTYDVVYLTP